MRTKASLPQDQEDILLRYRENKDYRNLHAHTLALCNAGWTMRAIADAAGVTRAGVQTWKVKAQERGLTDDAEMINVPLTPLDSVGSGVRESRRPIDVPVRDRERLRELAQQAKRVRRSSTPESPERRASAELDQLLIHYIQKRRVQPMIIARHAGVTRRAITARLERHADRQVAA